MTRALLAVAILLLALPLRAAGAPVAADDTCVVICQTQPPTAGLTATLTTPGGVTKQALTGGDGSARLYYLPSAGSYRATMEGSAESYTFAAQAALTLTFAVSATPTATVAPAITLLPEPTLTPTGWPTPIVTPLVMRLASEDGAMLGEIMIELWIGEDGEVELINLSGAVWRER